MTSNIKLDEIVECLTSARGDATQGQFNRFEFRFGLVSLGLVEFYGTSTVVGYLTPNPLYTIYIKYIGFGLVWFYGISTIVDFFTPNPLHVNI